MAATAVSRSLVLDEKTSFTSTRLQWVVLCLFFISGVPALIYQIAWQRALFAIYGVNIESVAVVVSAFMLGLGLGSMFGGYLSTLNVPLLVLFAGAEVATGIYGLASLRLFHYVALYTAGAPLFKTGCLVFLLLVVPTGLMGSTLPLLVTHIVRRLPNIGRATGWLYFVNTLGSACACFATGMFLMRLLALSGSVRIAGILNIAVGACVFLEYLRTRHSFAQESLKTPTSPATVAPLGGHPLPLWIGMMLAGAGGFIALAYEIIWCRVFSFATATNPKIFPYLLGAFLTGISGGSLLGEHLCKSAYSRKEGMFAVGGVLFGANLWALFVTSEFTNFHAHMRPLYGIIVGFCFVALAAALLSITFPLLCHLAIDPNQKAGSKLSFIYVSNIIGSSAGSLIFGYIMFEYFSLRTLSLVLGGMGLGLGIVVMACARTSAKRILACSIIALLALGVARIRLANTYEALSGLRWTEVLENRHDVITVSPDGAIFSGGGYDGLFNTDPVDNSNWILRIYAALSLQSAPHKVLMVGLSSGSWAQVIVNDPRVEHLTVVEINPGYLKIIPNHPQVSSLLGNPKLNVVIDDGRRWLLSHPAERYDLIVMNTPFHWRANMTNLLSREFIGIVRQHLQPDGVYFFNTTFSPDAQFTAYAAFHNVVRIANFVAASDGPLQLHKNQLTEMLLDYRIDGRRVIPSPPARGVFQEFAAINQQIDLAQIGSPRAEIFEYGPSLRMKLQGARVVTDDNMAVEWNRDLAAQ